MRFAFVIWLIFGVMMLGWYGFAMVGIGVVLYILVFIAKCMYDDRKFNKNRKGRGL